MGTASNTPIIHLEGSTSNVPNGPVSGSTNLTYNWEIAGADGEPVLVHVSTSGYIKYNYGFTPIAYNTYNLSPNLLNVGILAYFGTNTNTGNGYDQRNYGLQSGGNLNWGITRVEPTSNFTQQNGGESSLDKQFAMDFDLWVTPNRENVIALSSMAFLYSNSLFLNDYAHEHYSFDAFLDPTITIDASYGNKYTLITSDIPALNGVIPEPSEIFLVLIGIAVLCSVRMKRNSR